MKHRFSVICILLLLALPTLAAGQQTTRDSLRDGREKLWHAGEAVIEDAQQPARVCSTRPLRPLPSPMFRTGRQHKGTAFVAPTVARSLVPQTLKQQHSEFSPPYRAVASCDYYVIALRHILC